MTGRAPRPDLAAVLRSITEVEGWMSDAQAACLWSSAAALGTGALVVEIGSYHGRSAIVLASAAPADAEVVAIDPHAGNDRGPRQHGGAVADGHADHERFLANLRAAGVDGRIRHVRKPSQAALIDVGRPIDLLYIDGAHTYRAAAADLRAWGSRVRPAGTVLVHDAFSSIGVTLALARETFFGPGLAYVGRSGSMAEFRRSALSPAGRLRNAGRQVFELPWFARNLVVKALIVARLPWAARLLGHREGPWPY